MGKRIIITVAVTGSFPTKEMNPGVPYSPKEIAKAAVESNKAGASIAHIHVRDPETGKPAYDKKLFKEVLERIREKCSMIVNLTTSGLRLTGSDVIKKRLQPVELEPEMCSLDLGSMNFHNKVFNNPPQWGEEAAKSMQRVGVKPEIEVFEVGHIRQALYLIEQGFIDPPPYFQLCMGVRWGIDATIESLLFMKSKLPPDAPWSVLGIGASQIPMINTGILLGGNIRVGFEDNIYLAKNKLAINNAQMVEVASDLAERLGRNVVDADEARDMLGIKTNGA